ncbi:MAG: putative Orotidine 5-phosphate decarboxylase [Solirubrobacterales bacterium]|nr:putative Orotidine 5-phosphate decarboxylase [Solirubrobacterales bacterium]
MTDTHWPPIEDPQLLARLALDDAGFLAYVERLMTALGARECPPELLERALGYPWARPARSYLLRGEDVSVLDQLPREEVDRTLAAYTAGERFPLLAFGSNAAPVQLQAKLAHFTGSDRDVLVLAGELHGFDVGASSHPTIYGSMPATLFASPGTAVRAAVLWVTATQFTQLTWTEISYRLGRLDGARFTGDERAYALDGPLAFVSRFGAYRPSGAPGPVALAAIPARGRTAPAWTQEELLADVAGRTLGPGTTAADLVRRIFADADGFVRAHGAVVRAAGLPFAFAGWTPYPADGVAPGDDAVAPGNPPT